MQDWHLRYAANMRNYEGYSIGKLLGLINDPAIIGLIFIGYIAGILNKIATNFDHVIWLYCLNGSMVLTEIILYLKYKKPDSCKQSNLILKRVIKCIS